MSSLCVERTPLIRKKGLYTAGIYLALILLVGAAGLLTGCVTKETPQAAAPWIEEKVSLNVTLRPVDGLTVEDSLDAIIRGPDGKVKGHIGSGQKVDSAQNPPF